jgi:hypothetical protein
LRQKYAMYEHVITLKQLLEPRDGRDWSEPNLGLNIRDVLFHIHRTEQKFVLREEQKSFLVKPQRANALVESMFGAYPTSSDVDYIRRAYVDVYKPEIADATPDTWRRIFRKGALTPLGSRSTASIPRATGIMTSLCLSSIPHAQPTSSTCGI